MARHLLSSALFIAFFMYWLGRYPCPMTSCSAWRCRSLLFVMFENWFLVPLPKGPLEDWLGY